MENIEIKGHFKIEQIDKNDNTLDSFETENMIMLLSKESVAKIISGIYNNFASGNEAWSPFYINKFVLGTGGNETGNLLEPKQFEYDRTALFAENDASMETYPITFDPSTTNLTTGETNVIDEGSEAGNNPAVFSTVNIKIVDTSVIQYTIEIPLSNGNGSTGATAWTEAALYTKEGEDLNTSPFKQLGKIFAMRTFPAKIKEDSTKFKITWKIYF